MLIPGRDPAGRIRPRVPDTARLYVIGDVHGRNDLLANCLAKIDEDLETRPHDAATHIFLGDYIDRGAQSRSVIDLLIERTRNYSCIFLKGNHEQYLWSFLFDPSVFREWRNLGAWDTLRSYGIGALSTTEAQDYEALAHRFSLTMPATHLAFFRDLELCFTLGDYFFVHAGIRPGIPLHLQNERDLLSIREEFLSWPGSFEKVIVHGHTPVPRPDLRANRINIDTGAYFSGQLTCLVLERDRQLLL